MNKDIPEKINSDEFYQKLIKKEIKEHFLDRLKLYDDDPVLLVAILKFLIPTLIATYIGKLKMNLNDENKHLCIDYLKGSILPALEAHGFTGIITKNE